MEERCELDKLLRVRAFFWILMITLIILFLRVEAKGRRNGWRVYVSKKNNVSRTSSEAAWKLKDLCIHWRVLFPPASVPDEKTRVKYQKDQECNFEWWLVDCGEMTIWETSATRKDRCLGAHTDFRDKTTTIATQSERYYKRTLFRRKTVIGALETKFATKETSQRNSAIRFTAVGGTEDGNSIFIQPRRQTFISFGIFLKMLVHKPLTIAEQICSVHFFKSINPQFTQWYARFRK